MVGREEKEGSCVASDEEASCCKVEALVGIDERGQMVLPKEIRDKTGIQGGDKLALITWERGGEVCCISLVKVEHLAEMVKDLLGPVLKEIIEQ